MLSVAVAYTLNIGHRRFARDAMEDLPPRQVLFPVSTRRHFVPVFLFRDFPWLVRLSGRGSVVCRSSPQPAFAPTLSGGPFGRHRWTSPTRQHPFTHAPNAARGTPANPFLESPADSGTHAPNLQRLRQAGDARQDLVRISESTTKCGDYGEESGGDAEVSRIRGESGSLLRV